MLIHFFFDLYDSCFAAQAALIAADYDCVP